jgi:hypothetical protein
MKTALQEFIDNVIPMHIIELDMIKQEIKKALEKEKKQIIKAHIDGFDHIVVDFKKQEYAEQYYNQTYNQ